MKKRFLLMVVPAVLLLSLVYIVSIKACDYHVERRKEVVLQLHLWTVRNAIDFYREDKKRTPESLQDLVSAGYLREIPADPITKSNQTWIVDREKESSVPNSPPGVIDIHSGAGG